MSEELPIDIDTLAKEINRPKRQIQTWQQSRKIPFLKLGHRTLLFEKSKVLAAIRKFEVKAIS